MNKQSVLLASLFAGLAAGIAIGVLYFLKDNDNMSEKLQFSKEGGNDSFQTTNTDDWSDLNDSLGG
jgi:hypothetical protein